MARTVAQLAQSDSSNNTNAKNYKILLEGKRLLYKGCMYTRNYKLANGVTGYTCMKRTANGYCKGRVRLVDGKLTVVHLHNYSNCAAHGKDVPSQAGAPVRKSAPGKFVKSDKGRAKLVYKGLVYEYQKTSAPGVDYYSCVNGKQYGCDARAKVQNGRVVGLLHSHKHQCEPKKQEIRKHNYTPLKYTEGNEFTIEKGEKGGCVLVCKGYRYHLHRANTPSRVKHYVCMRKKYPCQCRVRVSGDKMIGMLHKHTHPPEDDNSEDTDLNSSKNSSSKQVLDFLRCGTCDKSFRKLENFIKHRQEGCPGKEEAGNEENDDDDDDEEEDEDESMYGQDYSVKVKSEDEEEEMKDEDEEEEEYEEKIVAKQVKNEDVEYLLKKKNSETSWVTEDSIKDKQLISEFEAQLQNRAGQITSVTIDDEDDDGMTGDLTLEAEASEEDEEEEEQEGVEEPEKCTEKEEEKEESMEIDQNTTEPKDAVKAEPETTSKVIAAQEEALQPSEMSVVPKSEPENEPDKQAVGTTDSEKPTEETETVEKISLPENPAEEELPAPSPATSNPDQTSVKKESLAVFGWTPSDDVDVDNTEEVKDDLASVHIPIPNEPGKFITVRGEPNQIGVLEHADLNPIILLDPDEVTNVQEHDVIDIGCIKLKDAKAGAKSKLKKTTGNELEIVFSRSGQMVINYNKSFMVTCSSNLANAKFRLKVKV